MTAATVAAERNLASEQQVGVSTVAQQVAAPLPATDLKQINVLKL